MYNKVSNAQELEYLFVLALKLEDRILGLLHPESNCDVWVKTGSKSGLNYSIKFILVKKSYGHKFSFLLAFLLTTFKEDYFLP